MNVSVNFPEDSRLGQDRSFKPIVSVGIHQRSHKVTKVKEGKSCPLCSETCIYLPLSCISEDSVLRVQILTMVWTVFSFILRTVVWAGIKPSAFLELWLAVRPYIPTLFNTSFSIDLYGSY